MPLTPIILNEYHVFLASPGDMHLAREGVRKFFNEWNQIEGRAYNVRFEVIGWEDYSSAGINRPQELITGQILERFRNSLVLVIGLMGQSFGTPTGESESGTEEEFMWALENWRKTGSPEIKFYFQNIKEFTASSDINEIEFALQQYKKVKNFIALCEYGNPQLYYKRFDANGLYQVLSKDLRLWLYHQDRPWMQAKLKLRNTQISIEESQEQFSVLKTKVYGAKKLLESINTGKTFSEKITEIRMLWIPKGKFQIGLGRKENIVPWIISSPFWIGETPVTNRQYRVFVENTGYDEPLSWKDSRFSDPQQPVVNINWFDAMAFCKWLSEITEINWSLPSEAQWEFAARSNDGRLYPWGNDEPRPDLACYGLDKDQGRTPLIGIYIKGRGPFGTFDQAGTVWEWCQDIWNENTYGQWLGKELCDPINIIGDGDYRVLRGACWADPPNLLKTYTRYMRQENYKYVRVGFRIAVNLKGLF